MEANELMIGDWVIVNSKPTKVEEVDGGSINTTYSYGEIEGYIDEDEISPIPLTAEILEKNGFRTNGTSNEYQLDMDAHTIFYNKKHSLLIIELCGRTCFEYCIANVHELQHALRLCGLTDLADNFTI